jgi:hypothetical protein
MGDIACERWKYGSDDCNGITICEEPPTEQRTAYTEGTLEVKSKAHNDSTGYYQGDQLRAEPW